MLTFYFRLKDELYPRERSVGRDNA